MRQHKTNISSSLPISDVENFKRKMLPKKLTKNAHNAKRKKLTSVNQNDVDDFKLKFHPTRYGHTEFEKKTVRRRSNTDQTYTSDKVSRQSDKCGQEKRFLCDVCSAMFKTSTNMKEHSKIHSHIKEYKCPHCDYACHRQRNLKTHILTHDEKKPVQCPKCEYTCIQNFQLKAHLLLHETDAPFRCSLCPATYKKEAGLKVHMLTHSNMHKFKCPDCKYVGNRYADFRRHVLIHSKLKPIKCPCCSYSCIRQSRLRAHMLVHRGKGIAGEKEAFLSSVDKNILCCDSCDYVCTVPSRLKKHQKSHIRVHSYTCNMCQFSCDEASSLQDHHKLSHKTEDVPVCHQLDVATSLPAASHQANETPTLSCVEGTVLLTNSHDSMLLDAQAHMFSQTGSHSQIFHSSEHPTIIFTTINQSDALATIQNEEELVSSNIHQWGADVMDWQQHFSVQDLAGFTLDHVTLQPSQNCLVAVVNEDSQQIADTLQHMQVPPFDIIKQEIELPMEELGAPAQRAEVTVLSKPGSDHLPEDQLEQARNHSTAKMYHCDQCRFSCDYKSTFKKHVRKHALVKNYKCAHCEYMCDELSRMKKHLIVHTDQKAFQCDLCEYSCKSKATLHQHVRTHTCTHNTIYQCTHCEYVCKSAAGLKSHLAKHLGENLYQCDLCQVACRSAYLLKKHKFSHGQKAIQCPYCPYSCVQQQQMNIHLLQHTYEYPFCCSICNAKYKKEDSLRIHILSKHDKKHRFSCTMCNYVGNRAADFREHMLTHSQQKPYQCPQCAYSCIRAVQLKKHLLTHDKDKHTQPGLKMAKKKKYRCVFCDFTCTRMMRLKAHLSKVHLDLQDNVIFSIDLSQLERSEVTDK